MNTYTPIDPKLPVVLKAAVLDDPAVGAEKYRGQVGRVEYVSANVPEYVMVFWRGLGCSSMWAARALENTTNFKAVEAA